MSDANPPFLRIVSEMAMDIRTGRSAIVDNQAMTLRTQSMSVNGILRQQSFGDSGKSRAFIDLNVSPT
jgi:hypothetical protein